MEFQNLKNFGKLYTGRASPRVILSLFTSAPKELGFLGTPKFLAKFQSKDRHWKRFRFEALEKRAVTSQDVIEGMQTNLAFYTALMAVQGKDKAMPTFSKLAEKLGIMIYEDFLPDPKDFLRCPDPWKAVRGYFSEFFQATARESVSRLQIVKDTDQEFQVHFTDCAWHATACEAGYPELMPLTARCDVVVMPRLMRDIGGDFKRESWLCRGEPVCDWHFFRHGAQEVV